MDLKSYVKQLTPAQRKKFCLESEISDTFLSALISESRTARKAGAKTIVYMVAASGGVLTVDSIRADLVESHAKYMRELNKSKKGSKAA